MGFKAISLFQQSVTFIHCLFWPFNDSIQIFYQIRTGCLPQRNEINSDEKGNCACRIVYCSIIAYCGRRRIRNHYQWGIVLWLGSALERNLSACFLSLSIEQYVLGVIRFPSRNWAQSRERRMEIFFCRIVQYSPLNFYCHTFKTIWMGCTNMYS